MLRIDGRSADEMIREITNLFNKLEGELFKLKSEILQQRVSIFFLNEEMKKIKNNEFDKRFLIE